MTRRLVAGVVTLIVVGLALPCATFAQQDAGPISWVALVKTKSGKSSDLIRMAMENDKPMYDKLLAEGKISAWGMAIPINHRLDDAWNHMTWVTTTDWAGIGHLQRGFEAMFEAMPPEKMKEMNETFAAAIYEGSHHDWLIRHAVMNGEDGRTTRYFYFGYWTAKPGKEAALQSLYEEVVPKAYGPLMASGAINGYGLAMPELHGESFTHLAWVAMNDLAGVDAIGAALQKAVSPEQMKQMGEIVEPGTHYDQVLLVIHNSRNPAE